MTAAFTPANQMTFLRMLLIPAFVILVVYHYLGWALLVFGVAGLTDALDGRPLVALETLADLDEYTYMAAGCVGEYWTVMTAAHVPTVLPDTIEQLPLQHCAPVEQTSPSGWQPEAVVMQVPP